MIRLRAKYGRHPDDGVAMLFVIAIGLVVTAFVVAMLASVLQNQATARGHRNITSAQSAAEAGLEDVVYQLSQFNSSGVSQWSTWPALHATLASAYSKSFGGNTSYKAWITPEVINNATTGNLVIWAKGTFGSTTNTRTIRAVVTQGSPPAFDYSMFASKGIDIHHHGSGYLSPQVVTTSVHSNGYINLDYSSEFTVNTMEAVGSLNFQKGGGSNASGSIPTSGYHWYDPLNGQCFPGGYTPTTAGTCAGTGTKNNVAYTGATDYSGNAMVAGSILAGSVTLGSRGQVLPVNNVATDSGQQLSNSLGTIHAGSASINGTSYTTAAQGAACSQCNKGIGAAAGQVSGALTVDPGYAPPVIPFPSINYATTYRVSAQSEQTASETHVFTGGGNFLSTITSVAQGHYRNVAANGTLTPWNQGDPAPGVIELNGDYDITSGSLQLNFTSIKGMVNAATNTNGPAPIILVRGSLVVEGGGITINSGLVVVGTNNVDNFITPGTSTTPVVVNTATMLDHSTVPGVLAAGGAIDSSDYDTDSPWTSTCNCYEPTKATPVYVRGLVYSASWTATSATTGFSTPQNQHWHNFDPKNLMKIYGAQVGADLHDCNNFTFTYDPIVKNALGFGGGTVKITDYQELGS